jgi:hypothetical protein
LPGAAPLAPYRHSPVNLFCEILVYLTVISIDLCPNHSCINSKKVGDCELAGSRRATSAVSKWTSGVFEQTCVALRIGCDDDVKQAIAKKIIELAPGERSPDQLCERALEDIRQPLQAAYRA